MYPRMYTHTHTHLYFLSLGPQLSALQMPTQFFRGHSIHVGGQTRDLAPRVEEQYLVHEGDNNRLIEVLPSLLHASPLVAAMALCGPFDNEYAVRSGPRSVHVHRPPGTPVRAYLGSFTSRPRQRAKQFPHVWILDEVAPGPGRHREPENGLHGQMPQ